MSGSNDPPTITTLYFHENDGGDLDRAFQQVTQGKVSCKAAAADNDCNSQTLRSRLLSSGYVYRGGNWVSISGKDDQLLPGQGASRPESREDRVTRVIDED